MQVTEWSSEAYSQIIIIVLTQRCKCYEHVQSNINNCKGRLKIEGFADSKTRRKNHDQPAYSLYTQARVLPEVGSNPSASHYLHLIALLILSIFNFQPSELVVLLSVRVESPPHLSSNSFFPLQYVSTYTETSSSASTLSFIRLLFQVPDHFCDLL